MHAYVEGERKEGEIEKLGEGGRGKGEWGVGGKEMRVGTGRVCPSYS